MKKQTKKKPWEMRLIILLNDELKNRLSKYCKKVSMSKSSIGRQAIYEFLDKHEDRGK